MPIRLAPYAGEPEAGDPAYAGEWADGLAVMRGEVQTPPWCSYLARRDGDIVGMCGFKGACTDGVVEIGYITFFPARGRGVATEAAGLLVDIAREHGATAVRAHTMHEASASTRGLEANGFTRVASVLDPQDGPVWRWERSLAA
jgi:RimJ/RimL family protein N-acetyltransferase